MDLMEPGDPRTPIPLGVHINMIIVHDPLEQGHRQLQTPTNLNERHFCLHEQVPCLLHQALSQLLDPALAHAHIMDEVLLDMHSLAASHAAASNLAPGVVMHDTGE